MSGAATEIENGVQEGKKQLQALQSALRKAKATRVIGTLAGLVIAIIYALLFISLIVGGLNMKRLTEEVQVVIADEQLQEDVRRAMTNVVKEVFPVYREALTAKALESGLPGVFGTEFIELAKEVGPQYYSAFKEMAGELELMSSFTDAMKDVASEVGPAYRGELNRIAPEVFGELQEMRSALLQDVSETANTWLQEAVKESLEKNADYVQMQTKLTPAVVEQKLAEAVVAAEAALIGVVKKRTDRYQADLEEIQAMLEKIPESKERDTDRLLDEIGAVSLALMKANLPEYKGKLE